MNIGFFGGTFDPIHLGHLALAQAALQRYKLGKVVFVPAGIPPHKRQPEAAFVHRYAMTALAIAQEKAFVPSLLEMPQPPIGKTAAAPNYSLETLRLFKKGLRKSDKIFFLIGIDAFKDSAKWYQAESLFAECEFVVASRPGFSLADAANSLPEKLRPAAAVTKPFAKHVADGDLILPGLTVHFLPDVNQKVSATAVRQAIQGKRSLARLVDPAVELYIKKTGLYGLSQAEK